MEAFRQVTGIAAPLSIANIDTDMILPARFMKTISRTGLGRGLMAAARFGADGNEKPDFILNRQPWRDAKILVALDNFGCGSSREHAPWALLDFGIHCVIAPSFADIFYGNCFKNGILPVILPRGDIDRMIVLLSDAETAMLTIDLERQEIVTMFETLPFSIDPQRRERMLDGADDIALSLGFEAVVAAHEAKVREQSPWLAEARLDQPGIWAPRVPRDQDGKFPDA